MPYSDDLRQKVLQAIEQDGLKKAEASQLFRISRNTIDLWFKRRAQTGRLHATSTAPKQPKRIITDWQAFAEFAKLHGDKTQAQMAELWPDAISVRSISRALNKIGFTRKKRPTATVSVTKLSDKPSSLI